MRLSELSLEKIKALPKKQQILLLIGAFVLAQLLVFFLTLSPRLTTLSNYERQEQDLKQQYQGLYNSYLKQKARAGMTDEYIQLLTKSSRFVATQLTLSQWVEKISAQAKKYHVTIDIIKPGESKVEDHLRVMPVEIHLKGNYHHTAAFLGDIANFSKLTTIDNLHMRGRLTEDDHLSVKVMVKLFHKLKERQGAA